MKKIFNDFFCVFMFINTTYKYFSKLSPYNCVK